MSYEVTITTRFICKTEEKAKDLVHLYTEMQHLVEVESSYITASSIQETSKV